MYRSIEIGAESAMKWEYRVQTLSNMGLTENLNAAGEAGWELVSATQDKDDLYTVFFKRQKPR
jgi:hypothetical protein